MKKTIYLLSVAALLATGIYAYDNANQQGMMQPGMQMGMQSGMMQSGMQPCGMMQKGMRGGQNGMQMITRLNLSDDQRHQLAILRAEMKLEMTKLRDPKMMNAMQNLMSADTFDKQGFIKMQNDMHTKMLAVRANHMEKVFNLLTKEQRTELKALMNNRPMRPMAPKQS
ncbi:MAG: Spy/CpxP family protein refolding chaperone [Sulfurospirillaceae bacterium]|nr:Spy/CpxP family protein refolding chaperone [Sulfurospirillaceae bacterium]MDD2827290.1 Spy/CpxP family protein refolding chaperone [Sulfurospirillaceae bacterium]